MSCDDFKQRLPFSRWDLEFEAKHKATWPAIEPVVESCWPSFSLTGHHNRLSGTQKGTPAIPRSLIPTSPDTSFLVTSGLTSDLPDISIYIYTYISISNRGISTVWAARMIASGRRIGLRFVTWPFRQLELMLGGNDLWFRVWKFLHWLSKTRLLYIIDEWHLVQRWMLVE